MCVRYIIGRGGEFTTHFGPGERKIHLLSVTYKVNAGVAGASNDWTGAVIRFSSHAKVTNEILFFKVMRKRETKFKSVFQSNAKTKNAIHIRFSK